MRETARQPHLFSLASAVAEARLRSQEATVEAMSRHYSDEKRRARQVGLSDSARDSRLFYEIGRQHI